MPLAKDVSLERLSRYNPWLCGSNFSHANKGGLHNKGVETHFARSRPICRKHPPRIYSTESLSRWQDFTEVVNEMEPSAMREVFVEVPDS